MEGEQITEGLAELNNLINKNRYKLWDDYKGFALALNKVVTGLVDRQKRTNDLLSLAAEAVKSISNK